MAVEIGEELGEIEDGAEEEGRFQQHRLRRVEGAAVALDDVDALEGSDHRVAGEQIEGEDADHHAEQVEPPAGVVGGHQVEDGDADMASVGGDVADREHPGGGAEHHDHLERPGWSARRTRSARPPPTRVTKAQMM